MKKVLTVLAVFLFLFTVQNVFAQEDPFKIGMSTAFTGKMNPNTGAMEKIVESSTSFFIVTFGASSVDFSTDQHSVGFFEYPKSGNGTMVGWIKILELNKYLKSTLAIENSKPKGKPVQAPVSKEESEKEAWRILKYFR